MRGEISFFISLRDHRRLDHLFHHPHRTAQIHFDNIFSFMSCLLTLSPNLNTAHTLPGYTIRDRSFLYDVLPNDRSTQYYASDESSEHEDPKEARQLVYVPNGHPKQILGLHLPAVRGTLT
jgi:hypothetical protein